MQTSTPSSVLGALAAGADFWSAATSTTMASDSDSSNGGSGQLASLLTNQQVTTLASLLDRQAAATAGVINSTSETGALQISEDDELKLLNFPPRREDLTTAIPLTVIFGLLLVTGCIGNICTAIVIARPKNKYMHTATNYYLFSLAMSDLLFLILGLPQEMYTLWQRYPYAMGESMCIIRGYLSEASTYASILTISAFTIERYVAICHPLWAHTMSQLPRAITSIVFIWIMAAICAIPPAAELGIVTQRGPLTNRTLEQSAQCATKRTIYENMFVVSAIVFFIVPMIIVTVLYILIAIELRRSSKMNSAISKQTSSHLNDSQHSTATTNSASQSNSIAHHHNHNHNHRHNHHNRHPNHHHHHHRHHNHNHHSHHTAANHVKSAPNQQQHPHKHRQHHKLTAAAPAAPPLRHNLKQQQLCCCPNAGKLADANASSRQQQLDDTNTIGSGGGAGEGQGNSLMANIMSQRPSSAIGNERAPACCPLLQPLPPPLAAADDHLHKQSPLTAVAAGHAPADAPNNGASNGSLDSSWTLGAGTATAKLCNNLLRLVWSYDNAATGNNNSDNSTLRCASALSGAQPPIAAPEVVSPTPAESNNNGNSGKNENETIETPTQATAVQGDGSDDQSAAALAPTPAPASATKGSQESLSRQATPLSYHESLIQRAHAHQHCNRAHPVHLPGCPLAKSIDVVQHQSIDNVNLSKLLLSSGTGGSGGGVALGRNNSATKCTCGQGSQFCCTGSFHATSSGLGGGGLANQARQQHQLSLSHLPGQQIVLHNKHLNHHYLHHHHQHHNHPHQHHNQRMTNQVQHHPSQQHSRRSNAASSKKSVIRMLVAVVVSFFICWVPFHAQRLLASYLVKSENQNQLLIDIYLKLTYISGVMYYLSSTINPLLYQLMSAKFRLAFKETFKCSIFTCAFFARRSSMAPSAANGAYAANHSPTNSFREPSTNMIGCNSYITTANNNSHNHKQQRSLCPTPTKANSCLLLAGNSNADLHRQDSTGSNCQCSACTCCCCCCCCSDSMRFVQPLPPANALARLRGRLNSSLASLLKLGSDHNNNNNYLHAPASRLNSSCSCQTMVIGSGGASGHLNKSSSDFAQVPASRGKQKAPTNGCCTPSLVETTITTTTAAATSVTQQQLTPKLGAQPLLCAKTPLLSGPDGTGHDELERASMQATKDTLQLCNLQTNFPTHHTMLKFIRSPTPSSSCNQPSILQSLTRVSSREDDEESMAGHSDRSSASRRQRLASEPEPSHNRKNEVQVEMGRNGDDTSGSDDDDEPLESSGLLKREPKEFRNEHSTGALDLAQLEMGALIRPTMGANGRNQKPTDEEEDADENDELLVTTSTEPSSGQSSVGTSPDQLSSTTGHGGRELAATNCCATAKKTGATASASTATTTASTTTATTTASSSSSQLSIPGLNHYGSKYRHLSGMRAEFGPTRAKSPGSNGARRQLVASKSAKSRTQNHQLLRHNRRLQEDLTPVAYFGQSFNDRSSTRRRSLQQTTGPQYAYAPQALEAQQDGLRDTNRCLPIEGGNETNKLLFSENVPNCKSITATGNDGQQRQHEKRHRSNYPRHRRRSTAAPHATVETISRPPPRLSGPPACETNGTNLSNGNNYLSSSVSSSDTRLDLMSSKRLSMSTTTTSVMDDNSYQLTTNSQLTSSNPNLAASRLAKNGFNPHRVSNCVANGNNFNNTSNEEEQDDIEIEEDPSTVINMQALQSDLVNCSLSGNETANLIANEANQLA